ncbi:DNA-binding transcriptional MerR regulator [Paucibacter oligotrophus]|uniref:DNA-binding transcriptional MerR regulator n=1 Tax=Roseateles oligotrophus TaxID=1769250 RepID=A0A840LBC9_9BURK|nr:MerR family transcriptional regulator [Roseateles oligotrophus]MBB4845456.1 DNA-binding transcriptional MerR regulator [Roseateles oligotrophus]
MSNALPAIPAKRYFTIGEVSDLCGVKPYVLRYWEQEFSQLKPMKRRGNRRYYQHHEVLLIRRIRGLLYEQGFTISGARNQLIDASAARTAEARFAPSPSALEGAGLDAEDEGQALLADLLVGPALRASSAPAAGTSASATAHTSEARSQLEVSAVQAAAGEQLQPWSLSQVREELFAIRSTLFV